MKTETRKSVTYLSINLEGNFYYKNRAGEKVVIPQDQNITGLTLQSIQLDKGVYKGEDTFRYLFTFVDKQDEIIKLSLNRKSHIGHLFCNKLLNCNLKKPMDLGVFLLKDDKGEDHRIICIYQDKTGILKKYENTEYPAIEGKDNTKRSLFFEEKIVELMDKLDGTETPTNNGVIYADEIDLSSEILPEVPQEYASKVEAEFQKFIAEKPPEGDAPDDLPF